MTKKDIYAQFIQMLPTGSVEQKITKGMGVDFGYPRYIFKGDGFELHTTCEFKYIGKQWYLSFHNCIMGTKSTMLDLLNSNNSKENYTVTFLPSEKDSIEDSPIWGWQQSLLPKVAEYKNNTEYAQEFEELWYKKLHPNGKQLPVGEQIFLIETFCTKWEMELARDSWKTLSSKHLKMSFWFKQTIKK